VNASKRLISVVGALAVLLAALAGAAASSASAAPAALPVAAASTPPTFLAGDAANGLAAYEQFEPAIAQGGSLFLAVWTDARTDGGRRVGNAFGGFGSDIYAARLDASGNLIDTTPFIIAQRVGKQAVPQVVWNGQNWLVAWTSQEPTAYFYAPQVLAARVSPQGAVLDPNPLILSTLDASSNTEFTLGSDGGAAGGNWVAFWQGATAGENAVRGARISPAGEVLDPGGVVLLPAEYYLRAHLDVAFAQNEYLLVWQGINVLQGKRLNPDLTPIDAAYFNISPNDGNSLGRSHVASNGTDFFAVWEAWVSTTYYDAILATRISRTGQVLDPSSIPVWQSYGGFIDRWPHVTWDGSNWFVSFMLNGITVLRVSPGGSLIDPNNIPADFSNASLKWSPASTTRAGGGIQLVWMDTRAGGSFPDDIYTAPVSANRSFGPEVRLSHGLPSQDRSSVAANGSGYLVAVRSLVSGSQRILAQAVDSYGNSLWPEPVLVRTSPSLSAPDVAFNGSEYLVVWYEASTIYARRLGADGRLLDPAPITVMPGRTPAVAALGGTFLVVGVNTPGDPHFQFPYAARVSGATGAVLDAPIRIGQYFATNPDVTSVGGRWLAAWERHWSHDDPHDDITAAFVDAGGAPSPEFVALDAAPSFYQYAPALAGSGSQALLVWEDPRVSNANWNLFAKRILADGTRLDGSGIPISTAPNNQGQAAAAWDGARFVVAFEDQSANTLFFDTRTDIYANRVSADGSVLDGNGFAVVASGVPEIFPAVAGANGSALISGSIYRDAAPFMAYRVGVFALGGGVVPATATSPAAGSPTAAAGKSTATANVPATSTATSSPTPPATATPTRTLAPTSTAASGGKPTATYTATRPPAGPTATPSATPRPTHTRRPK
jgi:hypothetical protein